MKHLKEKASPVSWLVFTIGLAPLFIVLLRPSFQEFALFFLVDFLAFRFTLFFENRYLCIFFPSLKVFHFRFDELEKNSELSDESRKDIFNSIVDFPYRFMIYVIFSSFFKCIPGALLILTYWKYDVPLWLQLIKVILIGCINTLFFAGVVFIETHIFLSQRLASLSQVSQWQNAFKDLNPSGLKENFSKIEMLSQMSVWLFVILIQGVLLYSGNTNPKEPTSFELLSVATIGSILSLYLSSLGGTFNSNALRALYRAFDTFDINNPTHFIPLHSSGLLAKSEIAFNQLIQRLWDYEAELAGWVEARTEQSWYELIGEISSLVIHDLGAPTHTMQYCLDEFSESPEKALDPKYVNTLFQAASRTISLIHSLRNYLRNPRNEEYGKPFSEIYNDVRNILKTEFSMSSYNGIQFHVSTQLSDISLKMRPTDQVHVLLNLLRNSIQHLLEYNVQNPTIKIDIESIDEKRATLFIEDNGIGLTKSAYEAMTSFQARINYKTTPPRGLGLRLIRRLVERNGGLLELRESKKGTRFALTVPYISCNPSVTMLHSYEKGWSGSTSPLPPTSTN